MTLFHYYTCFHSIRNINHFEIAAGCVFLACKLEFCFMKMEDAEKFYYEKSKLKSPKPPDFLKFEIEVLRLIGYEIQNIETPHRYFFEYLKKNYPNLDVSDNSKILSMGLKLINDCYRNNMCIYFTPRHIALASFYITLSTFFNYDNMSNSSILNQILYLNKNNNDNLLLNCLENLIQILEDNI